MTTTYSGDPSDSDVDWVRFRIQDTAATWKFTNEEIQAVVDEKGSKRKAAASLCLVMANRYAEQVDFKNLSLSESASQRAKAWRDRAAEILAEPENEARSDAIEPRVGGIYQTDRDNLATDPSRLRGTFEVGMTDHPGLISNELTGGTDRYRGRY